MSEMCQRERAFDNPIWTDQCHKISSEGGHRQKFTTKVVFNSYVRIVVSSSARFSCAVSNSQRRTLQSLGTWVLHNFHSNKQTLFCLNYLFANSYSLSSLTPPKHIRRGSCFYSFAVKYSISGSAY